MNILHQNQDKVTHDARSLSSGTLSYLIDNTNYDAIYQVQGEFVQFCNENAGKFENWIQAWTLFWTISQAENEVEFLNAYRSLSHDPDPIPANDWPIVHTPDGDQYTFAPADQQLSLFS